MIEITMQLGLGPWKFGHKSEVGFLTSNQNADVFKRLKLVDVGLINSLVKSRGVFLLGVLPGQKGPHINAVTIR